MVKIKEIKKKAKDVWNFLVHEDSWASFVVDLILIIIFAKFILYPGIGAAMGTDFPIVAVVSSSMDHHNMDFDTWWDEKGEFYEKNNISKEEFRKFYLADGFKKGDVLIIKGHPPDEIEEGDIIVFHEKSRDNPIIHRVVDVGDEAYSTKGDANSIQIKFEKNISYDKVEGKAVLMIPIIGWVKVGFVEIISYVFRIL